MIGSKTKRVTFNNWVRRETHKEVNTDRLNCPMGNPSFKDKRPEVIAALVAAQVIECLSDYAEKTKGIREEFPAMASS